MFELKKNISSWVPVRLLDSSGVPVPGVAFGGVTATVYKSDTTEISLVVTGSDWDEATTGAFTSTGVYALKIPGSALDLTGFLVYAVSVPGVNTFTGTVKVVDNEEVDTYSRIGAPEGASVSADIVVLRKHNTNKRQIHVSGGDANREVVYDDDDTTPIQKWDLEDASGNPTSTDPFTKTPV